MSKHKVIAFANQKGGVGKTTSAVNIAASMGAFGKTALLVDMDPQGNSTSGCGIVKRGTLSVYDTIINATPPEKAIKKSKFKGLDVLPSTIALAGAELELVDMPDREYRLKNALSSVLENYDYIFIDCPPYI